MSKDISKGELRGYVFVNSTMSDIQKAVQAAHACVELYRTNDSNEKCIEWAKAHKTIILLDGGNHGNMEIRYKSFASLCDTLHLPHAAFHEDRVTMNGAFTAFAGVIPSEIYAMDIDYLKSLDSKKLYWDEVLALFLFESKLLR